MYAMVHEMLHEMVSGSGGCADNCLAVASGAWECKRSDVEQTRNRSNAMWYDSLHGRLYGMMYGMRYGMLCRMLCAMRCGMLYGPISGTAKAFGNNG